MTATYWLVIACGVLSLVYAGYVRLNNRANAAYGFNINDYSTARGSRPTGYVFGLAHFF